MIDPNKLSHPWRIQPFCKSIQSIIPGTFLRKCLFLTWTLTIKINPWTKWEKSSKLFKDLWGRAAKKRQFVRQAVPQEVAEAAAASPFSSVATQPTKSKMLRAELRGRKRRRRSKWTPIPKSSTSRSKTESGFKANKAMKMNGRIDSNDQIIFAQINQMKSACGKILEI